MRYAITSTQRKVYLSGFYPNGGWKLGDVFAFRKNDWYTFGSEQEAQEFILYMKESCLNQQDRWGDWLDKALTFWKTLGYKEV